jgi:replicative DNA helicase
VERARVVWVEGEKDADRLWELGIPASTSAAGSSAWRPEYAEQLYRLGVREVVALPDNDVPGEAYAAKVVADCIRVGIEARVTPLPSVVAKGDVSDWLNAGNTIKELTVLLVPPKSAANVLSLAEAIEAWQLEQLSGEQVIVRSPFYRLNSLLGGGFSGGELIYVGSRPGIGKTSAALAFAKSAALDGFPALIVSREMVAVALARRMVTQESGIATQILKRNKLTLEEATTVEQAILKLKRLPVWITDKIVGIEEITKLIGDMVRRVKIKFLIADYLQLIRAPREIRERRHQVEAVSKGLKGIAVEHNIPVICLSSLSRPEKNSDKPPTLADLRESGELEHDADVVIFLHRKPSDILDPITRCILAKNREGSPGEFALSFDGPSLTFTETAASVAAS